MYDIYKTVRVDQPSIVGNTTFDQYWSVRKDKRTSGTINVASHFEAWEKMGLPAGKLYEAALNIEGYQSAGSATVLKNEMTVGEPIPTTEPATEKEPDKDGYYLHSTFESGKDGWTGRGDASVANHTWSHPDMTKLSADQMKEEISKCANALTAITGEEEFLIRPPFLAVNETFQQVAGVPLINCGVYSMDWDGASKDDIINTITSKMYDGSLNGQVVLVHENYETTAQAMEYLAPFLKSQGWQIVTVSEMFKANNKTMYNGTVYNNIW